MSWIRLLLPSLALATLACAAMIMALDAMEMNGPRFTLVNK